MFLSETSYTSVQDQWCLMWIKKKKNTTAVHQQQNLECISMHVQGESNPQLFLYWQRLWLLSLCHSAYEQKLPAGMKPSSPVTPPCSTPVSPLHHASPTAAPTPKPDRTYAHIPPSQPLPDTAYSMDHRYHICMPFTHIYICGFLLEVSLTTDCNKVTAAEAH